ncbi:MAG: hypothetical protein Kow0031_40370 [Anaerolineae bacterium]
MSKQLSVTKWDQPGQPTEEAVKALMAKEGVQPYRWSNEPGDIYDAHTHDFHKIIYVIDGSITFNLTDDGDSVTLQPGDRMDMAPGVVHQAVVGPDGVICLEGHK